MVEEEESKNIEIVPRPATSSSSGNVVVREIAVVGRKSLKMSYIFNQTKIYIIS